MSGTRWYAYDTEIDPPAPLLPVSIASPDDVTAVVLVRAIVDSGADMSVVPVALARDLGLPRVGRVRVRGVVAGANALVYAASIGLAGRSHTHDVLAMGDETIVGRDVLNRFVVTLDGPGLRASLRAPRS